MKKILFGLLFGILLIDWFLAGPTNVSAGCSDRLQCYIDEVNNEQAKYDSAQAKINLTEAQIKKTKSEINQILDDIQSMKEEAVELQKQIEEANVEIEEKTLQSKELFQYLQITNGNNVYMEYIFGAEDVTDLIYRTAIVEQLTKYNNRVIDELKALIVKNQERTKELEKKQKEMSDKKIQLDAKIASLEGEKSSSSEIAANAKKQLEDLQKQVEYFKSKGCEPNDRIGIDCMSSGGDVISAAGWYRPTERGRITQHMGWGGVNLDGFHYGYDVAGGWGTGEAIYPLANGIVKSTWTDNYGALMLVIYYQDSDGTWYTSQYAHLSRYVGLDRDTVYYPYVTKYVTPNTVVAYMGQTGFAFGVHLHLEFADCRYGDVQDYDCRNYTRWQNYIKRRYNEGFSGVTEKVGFPYEWSSR